MEVNGIRFIDVYGSINNNAHRQAAELIGAPAFVWHQALWNPPEADAARNWTADLRASHLQKYMQDVYEIIGRIPDSAREITNDIEVKPEDRARVISIYFWWNSLKAKIRFEVHVEYFTITAFIDASYKALSAESSSLIYQNVDAYLRDFGDLFDNNSKEDRKRKSPEQLQSFFYDEIWDRNFFPQVLNAGNGLIEGKIGQKFADFRGLITCEKYPDPEYRNTEDIKKDRLEEKNIQEPFYKEEEEERKDWQRTAYPDERWARNRLDSVWPVLSSNPRDKAPHFNGRTEFTANRLSKGRILYVTAFAPQPQEGSGAKEQPLYFYVHSSTRSERVLGRLVDRLTQLGTLRLAAIIPLPDLRHVRQFLEIVENDLTVARDKTHRLIQYFKTTDQRDNVFNNNIKEKEREILQLLDRIQRLMASLSKGDMKEILREDDLLKMSTQEQRDRLAKLGQYLGGASLEYRLIRSKIYKQDFLDLIDGLRIERLEGYQPYNEFVKRRLGGAFSFIDGVQQRIDQIKQNWRALDQLYLTTAVTILAGEIDVQQEIAVKQQETAVKQQEAANKTNTKIEIIQIYGEIILIAFLVPYYLIAILDHVLDCERSAWCHDKASMIRVSVGQGLDAFIFFAGLTLAGNKLKDHLDLKSLPVIKKIKNYFLKDR